MVKICNICLLEKPLSFFHKNDRMRDGHLNQCSKCRRFRCEPQNKEKKREGQLKHKYGITTQQYQGMFLAQKGVCAICRKPETSKFRGSVRELSIDHCHETKRVRGLLCARCNSAIGLFDEMPGKMQKALTYIFVGGFDGLAESL